MDRRQILLQLREQPEYPAGAGGQVLLGDRHDLLKEGVMPLAMLEKRAGIRIERMKAKG